MPNLSGLSQITSSLTTLSGLILVSPAQTTGYQPLNPTLPNGEPSTAQPQDTFVFDFEGEQTVTLESDITDHYVEDNISVQDQIALKPEIVTAQGYIGELNDVIPDFLKPLKIAADKLSTIGGYTPALTETALLAYSEAVFLYDTARNTLNSLVSSASSLGNIVTGQDGQAVIGSNGLTNGSAQNKQQVAFQRFYGFWKSRTLFNVQTPWAVFQNMAIKSLRAIQDAETRMITSFEVSFKMIRIASTLTTSDTAVSTSFLDGRAQSQGAGGVNNGTNALSNPASLGSGLSSMGVA